MALPLWTAGVGGGDRLSTWPLVLWKLRESCSLSELSDHHALSFPRGHLGRPELPGVGRVGGDEVGERVRQARSRRDRRCCRGLVSLSAEAPTNRGIPATSRPPRILPPKTPGVAPRSQVANRASFYRTGYSAGGPTSLCQRFAGRGEGTFSRAFPPLSGTLWKAEWFASLSYLGSVKNLGKKR